MKTAILYARVAQANEQAMTKVTAQFEELDAFCLEKSIEVIGSYYDIDSGATFDRKRFTDILNAIQSGTKKPDVILVTRWDRFSRSLSGSLAMIKTLRSFGVKVKSLQDFDSNDFEIILKHAEPKQKSKP